MAATPALIPYYVTGQAIPLLELPPPAISIEDHELVYSSVSRASSTSSNVLRVSSRGSYLVNYPDFPRGLLRVTNFSRRDLEADLDEEIEVTGNVSGDTDGDEHHDHDEATGLPEETSRRGLRFIDADLDHQGRSHSSATSRPGYERRKYEEIIRARSDGSTIRKDLAKARNAVKQCCTRQFNSVKTVCAKGKATIIKAGAGMTDVEQGWAAADVVPSGGISLSGIRPSSHSLGDALGYSNDVIHRVTTQPDDDGDLDIYRLARVQANPH